MSSYVLHFRLYFGSRAPLLWLIFLNKCQYMIISISYYLPINRIRPYSQGGQKCWWKSRLYTKLFTHPFLKLWRWLQQIPYYDLNVLCYLHTFIFLVYLCFLSANVFMIFHMCCQNFYTTNNMNINFFIPKNEFEVDVYNAICKVIYIK